MLVEAYTKKEKIILDNIQYSVADSGCYKCYSFVMELENEFVGYGESPLQALDNMLKNIMKFDG